MLEVFTVSFFGHRQIDRFFDAEEKVTEIIRKLIAGKEYVELLIGRDGEFDQIVSSSVRLVKRDIRDDNSELIWVIPYFSNVSLNLIIYIFNTLHLKSDAKIILSF